MFFDKENDYKVKFEVRGFSDSQYVDLFISVVYSFIGVFEVYYKWFFSVFFVQFIIFFDDIYI